MSTTQEMALYSSPAASDLWHALGHLPRQNASQKTLLHAPNGCSYCPCPSKAPTCLSMKFSLCSVDNLSSSSPCRCSRLDSRDSSSPRYCFFRSLACWADTRLRSSLDKDTGGGQNSWNSQLRRPEFNELESQSMEEQVEHTLAQRAAVVGTRSGCG